MASSALEPLAVNTMSDRTSSNTPSVDNAGFSIDEKSSWGTKGVPILQVGWETLLVQDKTNKDEFVLSNHNNAVPGEEYSFNLSFRDDSMLVDSQVTRESTAFMLENVVEANEQQQTRIVHARQVIWADIRSREEKAKVQQQEVIAEEEQRRLARMMEHRDQKKWVYSSRGRRSRIEKLK